MASAIVGAWAVGIKLELLGEEIIRDDECEGDGETIRVALQMHAYIGVQ